MLLSLLSRRSLEVDSRDAYGFAVRPHHLKRYQEYVDIYQEEEEERSDKWKFFLEQHEAKSDDSCSSEEKEEEEVYRQFLEDEITDFIFSTSGAEWNGCTQKEEEVYRQFLEDEITDFIFSTSGAEWNGCTQKEEDNYRQLLEAEIIDFIFSTSGAEWSDSTQNKSYFSGPTECDPQNGVQFEKELEKKVHLSGKPKEQFQPSEETEKKLPKKPWSFIRPSLDVIENMMCSRFKTKNDVKDEQNRTGRNKLGTIQEKGSMEEDGMEDNEAEEVVDKYFDCSMNNSTDKTIASNMPPGQFFPRKQELELLVQGGVPRALRGEVWQAFVGVKERRVESYYEELLAGKTNAEEGTDHHTTTGARRKWERQIEKDIPRTFPGHPALDERGRDSLRRLLVAYARHNPSVGYCQAMNFFAGLLLLLMPEENAFWTFMGIIDDYFEGYYTEEMIESQVDQLVLEELMRERFPKLVKHLDFLGVQVAWISGPWFLSIFVNMLPWESVLRIWDVLLFEGNRVMMFRTALALMDLYGPALVTTKDAGDAITLLQSLAGSTFDSSQLVLTACMGFLAVNETRLQELREKHRPAVLLVVEERTRGRVSKESKGLASKLYSFKHDRGSTTEGKKVNGGQKHLSEPPHSSELDDLLTGLTADSENGSPPDLQEQVVWFKVELCRVLEEKRSAILRAEELETALMEMVKADNRREMSAKIEELELEIDELHQALEDKKEQENAMLQVLIRVEHEQRIAEEARLNAENNSAAQRHALKLLEEKYEKSVASLAEMEQRVVVAESTLEATLQYHSGQAKALSSPRHVLNQQSSVGESPRRRISLFRLGWRDRNKGKPSNEDSDGSVHSNDGRDPGASSK